MQKTYIIACNDVVPINSLADPIRLIDIADKAPQVLVLMDHLLIALNKRVKGKENAEQMYA